MWFSSCFGKFAEPIYLLVLLLLSHRILRICSCFFVFLLFFNFIIPIIYSLFITIDLFLGSLITSITSMFQLLNQSSEIFYFKNVFWFYKIFYFFLYIFWLLIFLYILKLETCVLLWLWLWLLVQFLTSLSFVFKVPLKSLIDNFNIWLIWKFVSVNFFFPLWKDHIFLVVHVLYNCTIY